MSRYFLPEDIRSGTIDENGYITFYKDRDSVLPYTLYWDAVLQGDKILTSTWTSEGGNLANPQPPIFSENATTLVVSGTSGTYKNTITTERGYTHVRRIRLIERNT